MGTVLNFTYHVGPNTYDMCTKVLKRNSPINAVVGGDIMGCCAPLVDSITEAKESDALKEDDTMVLVLLKTSGRLKLWRSFTDAR